MNMLDVKTLLFILALGNLVSAAMIMVYRATVTDSLDLRLSNYYITAKLMQTLGYACLFARGLLPDLVSVNIGNTILIASYCFEAVATLSVAHEQSKRAYVAEFAIMIALCVAFNVTEFIKPEPTTRIVMASACVFLVFVVPVIMMVSKHKTSFMRIVVAFYGLSISLMLLRGLYALANPINIHDNALIQALAFIALVLLMLASSSGYLLLMKENADSMIRKLATIDGMTGLANRNSFFTVAKQAFDSHKLSEKPISILFLDIDNFKSINDRYGHPFGDSVLCALADALRQSVRAGDIVCRYSGDEIVVLLANTDNAGTQKVYERLTERIAELGFEFTVSVGAMNGVPSENDTPLDYIAKADQALYAAKNAGKANMAFYG